MTSSCQPYKEFRDQQSIGYQIQKRANSPIEDVVLKNWLFTDQMRKNCKKRGRITTVIPHNKDVYLGVIVGKSGKKESELKTYHVSLAATCLGRGKQGTVLAVPKGHKEGIKAIKLEPIDPKTGKATGVWNEFLALNEIYRGTGKRKTRGVAPMGTLFEMGNQMGLLTRRADMDMTQFIIKYGPKLNRNMIESITIDLMMGLNTIHRKGVTLGDIKTDNILIREKKGVVEAYHSDYGMAGIKKKQPLGLNGLTTGRYKGRELIGRKADRFGLGVVLYQLCTKNGTPPFKAINAKHPSMGKMGMLSIDRSQRGRIKKELENSSISPDYIIKILELLQLPKPTFWTRLLDFFGF